jgi:hypothetical protein
LTGIGIEILLLRIYLTSKGSSSGTISNFIAFPDLFSAALASAFLAGFFFSVGVEPFCPFELGAAVAFFDSSKTPLPRLF